MSKQQLNEKASLCRVFDLDWSKATFIGMPKLQLKKEEPFQHLFGLTWSTAPSIVMPERLLKKYGPFCHVIIRIIIRANYNLTKEGPFGHNLVTTAPSIGMPKLQLKNMCRFVAFLD